MICIAKKPNFKHFSRNREFGKGVSYKINISRSIVFLKI